MADENNIIIGYLKSINEQMQRLSETVVLMDNPEENHMSADHIRGEKAAMAETLATNLVDLSNSKYIRDDNRIILSAPEIIIGDIDKNGNLLPSSARTRVVIRSNNIELEGVGKSDTSAGRVTTRASKIHMLALDPGIDGRENYVKSTSEILSVAKGIEIRSESCVDSFMRDTSAKVSAGLNLKSEGRINIESIAQVAGKKKLLESRSTEITSQINEQIGEVADLMPSITSLMNTMKEMATNEIYDVKKYEMSRSYAHIDEANRKLESYTVAVLQRMEKFFKRNSQILELKRELHSVKVELKRLGTLTEKSPLHSSVKIYSPTIHLQSRDGDNNFRPDGRIRLRSPHLDLMGYDTDAESSKSHLTSRFNHITLDTSTITKDSNNKKSIREADGTIELRSAHLDMDGMNRSIDRSGEKAVVTKVLDTASKCDINFAAVKISTRNEKGECKGRTDIHSQHINISSTNKNENEEHSICPESSLSLLAETMRVGTLKYSNSDKHMRAEKLYLRANESLSIKSKLFQASVHDNIDDEKFNDYLFWTPSAGCNFIAKSGYKFFVDGSLKSSIESGAITLFPAVKFNGALTAGKITTDNMVVSTYFKSPNTQEGFEVNKPAASAPTASHSTEEDKIIETVAVTKECESRKQATVALEEYHAKESTAQSSAAKLNKFINAREIARSNYSEVQGVYNNKLVELSILKNKISIQEDDVAHFTELLILQNKINAASEYAAQLSSASTNKQTAKLESEKTKAIIETDIKTLEVKLKSLKATLDTKEKELEKATKQAHSDRKASDTAQKKARECEAKAQADEKKAMETAK